MNTKTITIKNRKIAVYQSKSEGTPVLFIHGNSLSAQLFSKQFDSELDNKYRLIAFDLPGHGNSDKPEDPEAIYSIPGYIKILKGVIAELQIDDYIIVGHSLGGHIAIDAFQELTGAKGYVIFGTPPLGIPPAMEQAFLPNPVMNLAFKGELTTGEAETLANAFVKEGTSIQHKIPGAILKTDPNARTMFAASLAQGKMKDELEIIKGLAMPLAIFHGEDDALVNADYLKGLEIPTLWKNKIQFIHNATHCPNLENPDKFNDLLNTFIEETRI